VGNPHAQPRDCAPPGCGSRGCAILGPGRTLGADSTFRRLLIAELGRGVRNGPSRVPIMIDPGTLIFGAISAFAAGASAIIAWFARADSLSAADRAGKAEESALQAWKDSALALKEANDLSVQHHAEILARERKIRRVEVAEHFRRWYTEEAMRRVLGETLSAADRAEKRELAIRITASGEPGASVLATKVIEAVSLVVKGDMSTAIAAAATISTHTHRWVEDPETFTEALRDEFTVEKIVDTLQDAVDSMETAMAADRVDGVTDARQASAPD